MEAQTALKKRQLRTTWEEGLVLPLAEEELPTATLTLTLRTCDRFSRHSVSGELRLGLDGVSVPLGTAQWGELKTSAKVGLLSVATGSARQGSGVWAELMEQASETFPVGQPRGWGPNALALLPRGFPFAG